jgi:hypothetical protein
MWFYTGLKPAQTEKVRRYDRLIFDVTYNDWVGDQDLFQNHWASIGLNTNFMFDIPLTKGNTVSLGIGLQHQLMRVRHDRTWNIIDSLNQTNLIVVDTTYAFNKSIYGANSFSIPVELRFRKESWRHFKLHLGGKIGYQVNAYNKEVTDVKDKRIITKSIGFPDQNNLIYGAHVRLGLRNWALFGSYQFNTLFSNKQSTKLNQIQFGLSLSLF